MNKKNRSTEIEVPTFVILKCADLPNCYRNLAVDWTDVCHDKELKYLIQYKSDKSKKWVVKWRNSWEYRTSCKSLGSAIRFLENIYKKS